MDSKNDRSDGDSSKMISRVHRFDWSKTPLGPQKTWPQSLRTLTDMCLHNRFPMTVWWGPALTAIYNDAYAPILGQRHPNALGQSACDVWADVWPLIGPQVQAVLMGGNATWSEQLLVVHQRNGFPENGWFTWSFSAIRDESDQIAGVLLTVIEDTKRVLAEQERDRLNQQGEAQRAQERAQTILESISDAFFSLGPNWEFTYLNREAGRILGRPTAELIGKSIWDEYPGLHGSDFEPIYRNAMDRRIPQQITQFYPDHDRWYEVHTYPSPNGISAFFRDVSEGKKAEEERNQLSAELQRQARVFNTALASTPDFIYLLDRDARFRYVNKPLLDLWGLTLADALGKDFFDLKYPDDLAAKLAREVLQVFQTKSRFTGETPYTSPTGAAGYFEYIFAPVFSPDGSVEIIAGSTRDISERKRLELEQTNLLRTLEAERANLADVVRMAPAFIAVLRGPDHIFELANQQYYKLIGRRDILGKSVRLAVPEAVGQGFIELLDRVYRTGEPFVGKEVPLTLTPEGVAQQVHIDFVYQAMRGADGNISGIFVHGVDVTNVLLARAELQERESRFRQLADSMPQIVWSAQPDGVLNYYNRRWFEYIQLPQNTTEDIGWARFVHPDDLPAVAAKWAQVLASGEPYNLEFRVKNGHGEYRWFLVRALPVRDDTGAILRWFGTCTDIEDRRQIESEREQLLQSERSARSESERAGQMKDEFLATLSHEVRTPLNAILGWSQIMKASNNPADIAKGLDVIERNARSQSQIIEDLLDMSRIISGKVRLDVQRLDLASIVQASVETARPTAETKGVRLRSVIDPLTGVSVNGDPNRLQQILWNLISNAVKFTNKGGLIQVVLERVNSHLEISVIDSGEGIQSEFLPFVFDRFRQADASTTRRHGGLGLGLSIVKQLVELHGGSVRVKSAGLGHGTTFIVALPLIVVLPESEPKEVRRHPRAAPMTKGVSNACDDIAGVRILVVDDEPDARALVRRLLEDCDAIVTAVNSVDEAVRLVKQGNFDVLVSDIGMPGQDGYALIKRIRSLPKHQGGDIPAIALTAYARAEDRIKAVSAGYLMHVAKPVEPVELVTMVAGAAGRTGH